MEEKLKILVGLYYKTTYISNLIFYNITFILTLIVGTRPNFIKAFPIYEALKYMYYISIKFIGILSYFFIHIE